MTLKKKLISGIGALAFIALLALNVQLVQNPTSDQAVSGLTLVELAAKADGGGEGGGIDWKPVSVLCSNLLTHYTTCEIGGSGCYPTFCYYD